MHYWLSDELMLKIWLIRSYTCIRLKLPKSLKIDWHLVLQRIFNCRTCDGWEQMESFLILECSFILIVNATEKDSGEPQLLLHQQLWNDVHLVSHRLRDNWHRFPFKLLFFLLLNSVSHRVQLFTYTVHRTYHHL